MKSGVTWLKLGIQNMLHSTANKRDLTMRMVGLIRGLENESIKITGIFKSCFLQDQLKQLLHVRWNAESYEDGCNDMK